MSLLAILASASFDNGQTADGPTVRAEFTQLLSALNATSTDKNLSTRFSGSDPTYAFDQLGAGDIAQFRKSGSELLAINNSGQVESSVTTGTAPMIVASTTKVTNLNADLLDGISSLGFLADPGGNGLAARTSAGTTAARTLTAPAAGITVSDGNGVSGNPTLVLANDLAALEGLGSTGIAVRSASDTWVQRTITGTSNQISVSNGNGVSGNPTLSTPQNIDTNADVTFNSLTLDSGSAPAFVTTSMAVGGGTNILEINVGTVTIDPGNALAAGGTVTVDFTVSGAAAGDWVIVEPPTTLEAALIWVNAVVTGADTVTLRIQNNGSVNLDGASRSWRYLWFDLTA